MNQFSVWSTPVFVASEIRETFKVAILKHTPPGKANMLLMVQKSGGHQLWLVVYPILYPEF